MRYTLKWMITLIIGCSIAWGVPYWYMLVVPGVSHQGPLQDMTSEERTLTLALKKHVTAIASVPHNTGFPEALADAANYIKSEIMSYGLTPKSLPYDADGIPVENIEVMVTQPANKPDAPLLVIGAHYDSAGDAPGANDNGTGTAALLALANSLKGFDSGDVEIRLVFFVNEEPPHFMTPTMGSSVYAAKLHAEGARVRGMIALECLGAFSDAQGSQKYPSPFERVFPTTGNFIAFVGPLNARSFMHEALGSFRKHTAFPSIGGVAPRLVTGIDWSDHASFDDQGWPAIMITDTAVYRYPHYHLPTDTPDKVDYEKLARLTKGIERVVRDLAR